VSSYEINFPAMNPVCSEHNKGFSVSCVLTASGFTNSNIRCLSGEVGFKFHVEVRVTLLNWISSESLPYKLLLVCKGTMIDIYDSNQIFQWLTQRGSVYKVTGEIKTDTYVSRFFRLSYGGLALRLKLLFSPLYDLAKKEGCFAILSFKSNPHFLKRRVKENLWKPTRIICLPN